MQILNTIVSKVLRNPNTLELNKTAAIYIHHALQSSFQLLRAQLQLGLNPKNTFVLNKSYSECKSVVKDIKNLGINYQECSAQVGLGKFSHSFIRDINALWQKVLTKEEPISNLIVMDHGGHALSFVPAEILKKYDVIGIEKTSAGLKNIRGLPFPIIETASCAAKKFFESPLIAEAVISKLTPFIPVHKKKLICGVIGYGSIGKAIADKLSSLKHQVLIYDNNHIKKNNKSFEHIVTNDLDAAMACSDYIFGCTGNDVIKSLDIFRFCSQDKTLISCSSEDKEFLSLIQFIQQEENFKISTDFFGDIHYKNDMGATITILKGGFPINFDKSGESVPHKDILLTRALVLVSFLQATLFLKDKDFIKQSGRYMLDPKLQKFVINAWIKTQPPGRFKSNLIDKFQDELWIAKNSGGIYKKCDSFL
jgi:hypothetical protein